MLVLMFLLVFFTFSQELVMSVTGYIHEGVYKVILGALFFTVISAVRYFALNFIYFNRGKTDEGESFLAGFGICGSLMIALYSLYMFVFLALLVPVAGIIMPEQCATIMGWLDSSYFAGDLYNNNLLLILFRDFLV